MRLRTALKETSLAGMYGSVSGDTLPGTQRDDELVAVIANNADGVILHNG
jgi:hypothetical protein